MAALQCEICGGALVAQPGGVFECEFCGTKYSKEWMKEKIQEIKGTVKVEGTVEVQGTVKVEGPVEVKGGVNQESLLKRGQMALEDGNWKEATEFFDQVLNMDAECAEVYFGKLLAKLQLHSGKELVGRAMSDYLEDSDYQKALRFADAPLKSTFMEYERDVKQRFEESSRKLSQIRKRLSGLQGIFSAGSRSTAAVQLDGTVVTTGSHDVSDWKDIAAVSVASKYIGLPHSDETVVGLRTDGTVAAAGYNKDGQCDVSGWKNIEAVYAGPYRTVGFCSDGTVVETGTNSMASKWKDIVAVSAGCSHTVGLRADGTVVTTTKDDVSGWKDIVAVSVGRRYTVGLRTNGTVVAVGDNAHGQCDVSDWKDIVAISTGLSHTVGLRSDGTVVAVGENTYCKCDVSGWKDIVAVSAGETHTVGLRADGTLVAVGNTRYGQCDVSGWKLFNSVDTIEEDRLAAKKAAEEERIAREEARKAEEAAKEEARKAEEAARKAEAAARAERQAAEAAARLAAQREREITEYQTKISRKEAEISSARRELANLKGLFTGKRRTQLEAAIDTLEKEKAWLEKCLKERKGN